MDRPHSPQPLSFSFTVHTETISAVAVVDLWSDDTGDRLVSLKLGDDRSGLSLLGQLDDVRRLIVEADRQLAAYERRDVSDRWP